jgi:hypothetical protein
MGVNVLEPGQKRCRLKERLSIRMLGVREDCIGGAKLDNFALIHHRNAIAEKSSDLEIMGIKRWFRLNLSFC